MNYEVGDVGWMRRKTLYSLVDIAEKYGANSREYGLAVHKVYRYSRDKTTIAGCSKKLSDREYKYYQNKLNQAEANRRAVLEYRAAIAPKTYDVNVNHTGSSLYYGY